MQEILERLARLEATLARTVRVGEVVGVDERRGTVRVRFSDADALVSSHLPVLFAKTHADKCLHMPDLGEHVTCVFLPNGQEEGFVLGAFYSQADAVPVASRDVFHVRFRDGAVVEYDRAAHFLKAIVPGQVDVTASGAIAASSDSTITARAAQTIRIEAPVIELAGNTKLFGPLTMGGAGGESLPLTINGPVIHRGGNFVSENDVFASGVSLLTHFHEGGSALPVASGGSAGSGDLASWSVAAAMASDAQARDGHAVLFEPFKAAILADPATIAEDRLLLCLPDIAEAMAARSDEADATGWNHLADFLRKWFVGAPSNDKAARAPSFVSWDWLLEYPRMQAAWAQLATPAYLFSEEARGQLAQILAADGMMTGARADFNYIDVPLEQLTPGYFQHKGVDYYSYTSTDGLAACMGRVVLYAVAAGYVEPVVSGVGPHKITVERVAIFVRDAFDFIDDRWWNYVASQPLGYWNCAEKRFTMTGGTYAANNDFGDFQARHGAGGDFHVYALPHAVAAFEEVSYVK
jgi:phage baseplate assembly protein V